jgi:hypothetical protein
MLGHDRFSSLPGALKISGASCSHDCRRRAAFPIFASGVGMGRRRPPVECASACRSLSACHDMAAIAIRHKPKRCGRHSADGEK